jgi:predicted RNA-binding Zn-ribbon protein involved in translation (DUF1610 family)
MTTSPESTKPASDQGTVLRMSFQDMIIERTRGWMNEYDEANLPRIAEAFTMSMRERGDYFSYFNLRQNNSQWRVIPGKGLVTFPIIGRSIRAKTATAVATKIQTEVESNREVPEKQAAAELARNIARYCRDKNWTKQTESTIAMLCQLARFCFVYNDYKTEGGMIVEIPETQKRAVKSGDTVYTCSSCGLQHTPATLGVDDIAEQFKSKDLGESEQHDSLHNIVENGESQTPDPAADPAIDTEYTDGEYTAADDAPTKDQDQPDEAEQPQQPAQSAPDDDESQAVLEHTANLSCPECQTNTLVMDSRARYESVDALTGEYHRRDCGFMDSRVVSPLLIRFDSYNSLGFEYKRGAWFNYHPLVPAYELLASAPHLAEKLSTGANKWSEAARLHYELNNNTSSGSGYSYRSRQYHLDDLVEVNVWWIAPHACVGFREGTGFTLPVFTFQNDQWVEDPDKAQFSIEADETIEEAYMRQYGSFSGMLVIVWQDEIIGIGNEHFCEKWTGVPWKIDPQSGFPKGEENLLKPQDAATNVCSMAYSHTRKRSMPTLIADPMGGFTEQAVKQIGQPGSTAVRQPVTADANNQDWRHFLGYLEPGEMSQHVFNFIQFIIEIAKEESGVFDETVGNTEAKETLGGRKMALNQSLSLMTPTQQSKALALVENTYIWLELWQKYAPDEAYTLIKGTFEEEWKPQDIEAFKALDIRRELAITIVEGTDIPRTQREMEERFLMAVNFGLFAEPNPLPIQIRAHIVKSVLGIDFDIGNYAAYKRLAHRRYEVLTQELEILEPNEAFTILPDAQGFPTRQLRPEILASMMQDPRTAPRDTDEHLVFIEFYTDRINGLAGAKEPDEVLIAACEAMISAHRAFTAMKATQANIVAGIAQNAAQPTQPQLPPGEGQQSQSQPGQQPQPKPQPAPPM